MKTSYRIPCLLLAVFQFATFGCGNLRLRQPSAEEKRHYVFSRGIDEAVVDANEQGPLTVLPALAESTESSMSPLDFAKAQHDRVRSDVILVGYGDDDDGMDELSGDEKATSVVITVLIVAGVVIGAAVPLLYLLDVF